ncbi:MAG: septal ring lytic transglycosylase RlpA family protein [Flavobacterium sp.]|nr:MAG: septal ring lytic transglycosylase RlpA family protein [Flavobacterium sp.]
MRKKITFHLLSVLAIIFLSAFTIGGPKAAKKQQRPAQDTVKVLASKLDSIAFPVHLKYKPFKRDVHASYYADRFNGKRTANGSKFNNNKYTAAHRKFPFGTKLRLTNEQNGKCVIVEVTDRGPFSKGREIDITKRAFREIAGDKSSGGINVTIEVVE